MIVVNEKSLILMNNFQTGATLDHVAGVLIFDNDATFGWITGAAATVNEEARSSAHIVRG